MLKGKRVTVEEPDLNEEELKLLDEMLDDLTDGQAFELSSDGEAFEIAYELSSGFDPAQPRDSNGRWTETGADSRAGSGVPWARGGTQEKHFRQKASLEGSKVSVKFRGAVRSVIAKNVRTAEEVGLRKSPVTHVADAVDGGEHLGVMLRFPSGNWKAIVDDDDD